MKIINKNDGRVSTKGVIITIERSLYLGIKTSNKKKDWWDNRIFSTNTNSGDEIKGYSISFMRVALFIAWTI